MLAPPQPAATLIEKTQNIKKNFKNTPPLPPPQKKRRREREREEEFC